MSGVEVAFGGAAINAGTAFSKPEDIETLFKALEAGGCHRIDTATLYGESERLLKEAGAAKRFTIDSKAVGGFIPGRGNKDGVMADAEKTHELLGPLDIWYLHSPSSEVHVEEILAGVNEIYRKGYFKRFGLSNFKAEAVQEVHDIAKKNNWVLPTVYQGNYNAASRRQETALFPTLRKLNIAFYAYSPLAGGFLTKSKQDIADKKGRFNPDTMVGGIYTGMYSRPTLLEGLAEWQAIAEEEGVSRAELAYRWVAHNSPLSAKYGDGIIIGASSVNQVTASLAGIKKGSLSEKAVKKIDHFWSTIEHEAPLDNFHK